MSWVVSFASFINVRMGSEAFPTWLGLACYLANQISHMNHFYWYIFVVLVWEDVDKCEAVHWVFLTGIFHVFCLILVLVVYAIKIFLLSLGRSVHFAWSLGLIWPLICLELRCNSFACECILVGSRIRVGVRSVKLGCGLRGEWTRGVLVESVLRVLGFVLELVVH